MEDQISNSHLRDEYGITPCILITSIAGMLTNGYSAIKNQSALLEGVIPDISGQSLSSILAIVSIAIALASIKKVNNSNEI